MAEGLALAALLLDGGGASNALAFTGSHFCAAERQYRFPLEYGGQRTPTSQWTVTGAGSCVLTCQTASMIKIPMVTIGRVVDMGVSDANNMGAAMAWAAYRSISAHLEDLGLEPEAYDLIATGDLGKLGSDILRECFGGDGIELGERCTDCGLRIFDRQTQDVHCGGSGAGCSAAVLAAELLPGLVSGRWRRILFCGTGALLSPTTVQQKRSIPAICHCVSIEAP
jgi:stage V sporulation protein AD